MRDYRDFVFLANCEMPGFVCCHGWLELADLREPQLQYFRLQKAVFQNPPDKIVLILSNYPEYFHRRNPRIAISCVLR